MSKVKKIELTLQQERFCNLFVSQEFFGNGTRSYIEAYDVDLTKEGAYDVAKSCAYDNLTKPHLVVRINELLEEAGLNDSFVDKQLLFLITQHADFGSKISAIKEYNKLKQRIIDRKQSVVEIAPVVTTIVDGKIIDFKIKK